MSTLEEIVRMHVNAEKWIKLKEYGEHQIAICMYHPRTEESETFIVEAYQGLAEDFELHGQFMLRSIAFTERKFKKKDKRIAKWYFRELCRSLKNGLLMQEPTTAKSRRRW